MNTIKSKADTTSIKSFSVRPIGYVHSGYIEQEDVPHTHTGWTVGTSQIQLFPKYAKGLGGLKGYSHIIVLFWIHKSKKWKMPKNHKKPAYVKVFATRMPVRPNSIGMSVVELLDFSTDTGRVTVKGLDALNSTPVIDIKPYIPNFDSYSGASVPNWLKEALNDHHYDVHSSHSHNHKK
jgi:tRNA-Thr(GGU) m(6)t(6)A37 methyltransferase TsaA